MEHIENVAVFITCTLMLVGAVGIVVVVLWAGGELGEWWKRRKKGKGHVVHDGIVLDVNPRQAESIATSAHSIPGVRSVTIVEKGQVQGD